MELEEGGHSRLQFCLRSHDPDAVVTRLGTFRKKYHLRATFQAVAFLGLVGGYAVYNTFLSPAAFAAAAALEERQLQEEEQVPADDDVVFCSDINLADPGWTATFYGIGVLYMFLALAIVCDEFFVPALEEMSSSRRMNLSMDVAGATLMAAGGSAPELFTSLFGTFKESEIGFGTIVGSAVFNVLFVIAMCSVLANELLVLTWWPLFRDASYYAIGLVVLSLFTGVISPDIIEMWEAIVLFVMYLVYILIMWQNANLYKMITGKVLIYPEEDEDDDDKEEKDKKELVIIRKEAHPSDPSFVTEMGTDGRPVPHKQNSQNSVQSVLSHLSATQLNKPKSAHFRWQGTFRAGILKLLRDPDCWIDTAGVGMVARIAGDADYVFSQVDIDGNGHVDREELKHLFNLLECYISPLELEEVFNQLDVDKDGTVRLYVVVVVVVVLTEKQHSSTFYLPPVCSSIFEASD
jgi:Ca2+/Na+ antiporter